MTTMEESKLLAKRVLELIRRQQGLGTDEQALHFWDTLSDEEKLTYITMAERL